MEEDCFEEDGYVKLKKFIKTGSNIRLKGEILKKKGVLLKKEENYELQILLKSYRWELRKLGYMKKLKLVFSQRETKFQSFTKKKKI